MYDVCVWQKHRLNLQLRYNSLISSVKLLIFFYFIISFKLYDTHVAGSSLETRYAEVPEASQPSP